VPRGFPLSQGGVGVFIEGDSVSKPLLALGGSVTHTTTPVFYYIISITYRLPEVKGVIVTEYPDSL